MLAKSEHNEQVTLVNWFRAKYPDYIIAAIPNGGKRSGYSGKRMVDEGLLKGYPDLIIHLNNGITFNLEMKSKKGKISECQSRVIDKLINLGSKVYVAYGVEEAKNIIEAQTNAKN